jgi:natural product precursor
MKTKTFSKKLSLNKKTVADLNNREMQGVHGGATEKSVCITRCVTNCDLCTMTRCSFCCFP